MQGATTKPNVNWAVIEEAAVEEAANEEAAVEEAAIEEATIEKTANEEAAAYLAIAAKAYLYAKPNYFNWHLARIYLYSPRAITK